MGLLVLPFSGSGNSAACYLRRRWSRVLQSLPLEITGSVPRSLDDHVQDTPENLLRVGP